MRCCVVALIGLPGAGKSSLASAISSYCDEQPCSSADVGGIEIQKQLIGLSASVDGETCYAAATTATNDLHQAAPIRRSTTVHIVSFDDLMPASINEFENHHRVLLTTANNDSSNDQPPHHHDDDAHDAESYHAFRQRAFEVVEDAIRQGDKVLS